MCNGAPLGISKQLKDMKKVLMLCQLDAIPDPGSRGFSIEINGHARDIMVLRRNNEIFGYINSCPHTGACLDWQPGEFLNLDQTLIICALHGAEFRIDDGCCVAGPCQDDSLEAIEVSITDNAVVLKTN